MEAEVTGEEVKACVMGDGPPKAPEPVEEFELVPMLTREQILEADDIEARVVDLRPVWPGAVTVCAMTGEERGRFDLEFTGSVDDKKIRMREYMVVNMVHDANGGQMFTKEDIPLLSKKNGWALDQIFNVATSLAGITEESEKELEEN